MNKKRVQEMANMIPPYVRKAVSTLQSEENMAVFVAVGKGVDTLDYLTREFGVCPIKQVNALAGAGLVEGGDIRPFVCKVQWTPFGVDFMTRLYDVFFPKKVKSDGTQPESTDEPRFQDTNRPEV